MHELLSPSLPALPHIWYSSATDDGALQITTQRTLALSTPMPNAVVATTTRTVPDCQRDSTACRTSFCARASACARPRTQQPGSAARTLRPAWYAAAATPARSKIAERLSASSRL